MKKGNHIRKYRNEAGLSQRELADIMGCEQSTISNYERGDRRPGLEEIRSMIAAFEARGVEPTIDDLFPANCEESAA